MITIVAKVQVLPGKEETFIEIFTKLSELVKKEPGMKRYDLYRSVYDPTTLLIHEGYSDEEAITAHSNTPYFKAAFAEMGPLFARQPEVQRFQQP